MKQCWTNRPVDSAASIPSPCLRPLLVAQSNSYFSALPFMCVQNVILSISPLPPPWNAHLPWLPDITSHQPPDSSHPLSCPWGQLSPCIPLSAATPHALHHFFSLPKGSPLLHIWLQPSPNVLHPFLGMSQRHPQTLSIYNHKLLILSINPALPFLFPVTVKSNITLISHSSQNPGRYTGSSSLETLLCHQSPSLLILLLHYVWSHSSLFIPLSQSQLRFTSPCWSYREVS